MNENANLSLIVPSEESVSFSSKYRQCVKAFKKLTNDYGKVLQRKDVLRYEKSELKDTVEELRIQLSKSSIDVSILEGKIVELDKDKATIEVTVEKLQNQLSKSLIDVSLLEAKIVKLNEDKVEFKATIDGLEKKLSKSLSDLSITEKRFEDLSLKSKLLGGHKRKGKSVLNIRGR